MRLASTLLLAALSAPLGFSTAAAQSPLVLNEIMAGPARDWDGSGAFSSRDDEWIELVNVSAGPVDLGEFFLTDGDSIPRFALNGSLAPGARLVVFGRDAYLWEQATGHPAFGLSLGNSGDEAILWRIVGPDTSVADRYAYRSHEAAADRSIARSPDGAGAWVLYDGLNLYTGSLTPGSTGCEPTPDAANLCGSTPAREATWGRVKSLYRDGVPR